jgi:hypothetical protein
MIVRIEFSLPIAGSQDDLFVRWSITRFAEKSGHGGAKAVIAGNADVMVNNARLLPSCLGIPTIQASTR